MTNTPSKKKNRSIEAFAILTRDGSFDGIAWDEEEAATYQKTTPCKITYHLP